MPGGARSSSFSSFNRRKRQRSFVPVKQRHLFARCPRVYLVFQFCICLSHGRDAALSFFLLLSIQGCFFFASRFHCVSRFPCASASLRSFFSVVQIDSSSLSSFSVFQLLFFFSLALSLLFFVHRRTYTSSFFTSLLGSSQAAVSCSFSSTAELQPRSKEEDCSSALLL